MIPLIQDYLSSSILKKTKSQREARFVKEGIRSYGLVHTQFLFAVLKTPRK